MERTLGLFFDDSQTERVAARVAAQEAHAAANNLNAAKSASLPGLIAAAQQAAGLQGTPTAKALQNYAWIARSFRARAM